MMRRSIVVASLLIAGVVRGEESPSDLPRLTFLDGHFESAAGVVAIDAAGVTFSDRRVVPIDDVREIAWRLRASVPAEQPLEVHLTRGGALAATRFELADDEATIDRTAGPWKFSIDELRAVRFVPAGEAVTAFLHEPPGEKDRLLVQLEAAATTVEGYVEKIDGKSVTFDWMGRTRSIPREKVQAIVFSDVAPTATPPARLTLELNDGSRLPVTALAQGNDAAAFEVRLSAASRVSVPASEMRSLQIRSERLLYLSDLTPVTVEEQVIAAFPRPWRPDRSVLGNGLMAAGQPFEKGIGVQSGSSLTFDLESGATDFAAILAIDPKSAGGDCVFVVEADGRELLRERLRSSDPPRPVRIAIPGVRSLRLGVEFGEDLDFGDHANWCDARVLRSPAAAAE